MILGMMLLSLTFSHLMAGLGWPDGASSAQPSGEEGPQLNSGSATWIVLLG